MKWFSNGNFKMGEGQRGGSNIWNRELDIQLVSRNTSSGVCAIWGVLKLNPQPIPFHMRTCKIHRNGTTNILVHQPHTSIDRESGVVWSGWEHNMREDAPRAWNKCIIQSSITACSQTTEHNYNAFMLRLIAFANLFDSNNSIYV